MTSSLSLRSVKYLDRIKSSWFSSLSSYPKMPWCRCSFGIKWHSSVEVSGVILLFVFVSSWGSGVLNASLWDHYCQPHDGQGWHKYECIWLWSKRVNSCPICTPPASLATFPTAAGQSMPRKLLSVRLPLSFAFSRKKDFSKAVPEASWSERLCKHFMIVHVKGLNHETTWHTALLWPISGFCLNTSPRSNPSPFSLHGSQLPWG